MFYVWLLTSGFLVLSILAQIDVISYGIFPDLLNIILTIALEVTTASLMIKKLQEPHKTSYSLKAVGLWFCYYGIFMVFTFNRVHVPLLMFHRVELGLLVIALGSLIYFYNKEKKELPQSTVEQLPVPHQETQEEKLFSLVFEIENLLACERVTSNKDFMDDLESIERYILEIQQKDIYVRNSFLDQVIEIYQKYSDLSSETIPTDELIATLNRVEELTKQIKTAFGIIHQKALLQDAQELDYQITALENQLRLNGLVESDFKIS